jgi:uncharacterized membrane protein
MNKRKLLYIIPIVGIIFTFKDLITLKVESFNPMVILSGLIQGFSLGILFILLAG